MEPSAGAEMAVDSATPITGEPLIRHHFTPAGYSMSNVMADINWVRHDVKIGDFEQKGVEAPDFWSERAAGIAAKLYFATVNGHREYSVRQLVERVVKRLGTWVAGEHELDPQGTEIRTFKAELSYILLHQMAAFNTPVWLNLGVPDRPQTASACFLLGVEDNMPSITEWWAEESKIFKAGAGSGINVSTIRGSMEPLSTGGIASGPCAYMRPADSGAGTLKSGGAHRRAAKLVCINDDHPDLLDFIDLKVRADEYMQILRAGGVNLDPSTPEGERNIAEAIPYQNANHSVRVTDEFMNAARAAFAGQIVEWPLKARVTGKEISAVDPGEVLRGIAEAAWKCADPGLQYIGNIDRWHTTPNTGPINTSNPCGEVVQQDDTACNLASINLLKFVDRMEISTFRVDDFRAVVDVMILAMDATTTYSDLPTEQITFNVRRMRQLGLGYSNLGAMLMQYGLPYDSDGGRRLAAQITSLMTARSYRRSAILAARRGAFTEYEINRDAMLSVICQHRDAMLELNGYLSDDAADDWSDAILVGEQHGYRNAQVTVLAPTGTISYLMDCDTTGVEPAFSLEGVKHLAGGGKMEFKLACAEEALIRLGYPGDWNIDDVPPEHRDVFHTASEISPQGHVLMMGAVQPFLSGAISKTVNLPNDATVEDVLEVYMLGWEQGCKGMCVYRDGSKATQVLHSKPKGSSTYAEQAKQVAEQLASGGHVVIDAPVGVGVDFGVESSTAVFVQQVAQEPTRKRLPRDRKSSTHKLEIGDQEGYLTIGYYEDGTVGEMFLNGFGKEGSFTQGVLGTFATAISIALQYGVPLEVFARKFATTRFEPAGQTAHPEIRQATSVIDYIMRVMSLHAGDADLQDELGVMTPAVKQRRAAMYEAPPVEIRPIISPTPVVSLAASSTLAYASTNGNGNGHHPQRERGTQPCTACGGVMRSAGSCYTCPDCGATTGCG